MHFLEQSATGTATVIQSGEPLLERARLKSVLPGKGRSGQVAAVEKLDELSALGGGVIRATCRSMMVHPQSLSLSTHLREDVLGFPLTIERHFGCPAMQECIRRGGAGSAGAAPLTSAENLRNGVGYPGPPH